MLASLRDGGVMRRGQMLKIAVWVCVTLILFTGCFGFVYDERIEGRYRLVAVDVMDQLHVAFEHGAAGDCVSLTGDYLYQMAHNDRFILSKHYGETTNKHGLPAVDKSVSVYYIVEMNHTLVNGWDAEKKAYGPLTEEEFARKKAQLGIPADIKPEDVP